ncbi:MAG: UPF0182 family protein [Cyanothece sp. SIO1E1]|nr:UPF0182 family protein [Cyanothece sp. SIO1E1]
MKRPQTVLLLFILIAGIALAGSGTLVHLLTEVWWFDAAGFVTVFWTRLTWQVLIWLVTFLVFGAFLWVNFRIAMGVTRDRSFGFLESRTLRMRVQPLAVYIHEKLPNYVALVVVLLIAASTASTYALTWERVLKFFNASDFGTTEPIYKQDIGFYLFQLPFYEAVQQWVLVLLGWGLVISALVYSLKGAINLGRGWKNLLAGTVKIHLGLLLAAIAVLIAVGFWLQRYELLYSPTGVVFGAGYADIHARLQAYWVMGFVTLALAGLIILSLWRSGFALPTYGMAIYLIVLVVVSGLYPWFQQQFMVEPNELDKEKPYIAHNIELTRSAYGLNQVQRQSYPAQNQLDRQALEENQSTIRNIRLWDYRPLRSTYSQLQEIRLYYRFNDVDVDRYTIEGDARQVVLAARELDISRLPAPAQTWVNQRLKYTHGYGIAMSPVDRVTPDGLPEFLIKDIPPVSSVDLPLEQPAIYYGEGTRDYIFTGTSTDEFDYPLGGENAATRYNGQGGVPMPSLWQRLIYAWDFRSLKILISSYFTPESRIHYYRQVGTRVRKVAPFLRFDGDPYIALIDGRLQWILDAYTVSDRYPYSEPVLRSSNVADIVQENRNLLQLILGNVNYIRNSVKVVVDAYDGTMQFFAVDESDPVLATYRKIFPDLFQPSDTIPPEVRAHFRYPLDLFKVQSQMYLSYHMGNPEVFYNREDLWRFPTEIYEGNSQLTEPYYVIMRLPEGETEEFILILPFTPVNKDNMIAWMAARSDGANYGKLLLYEFPKQELVYGPSQIEARIDQTPEISQQLTLWSQKGSRVIRGDLLVIPIQQSLLYVEPVYLRAEQGELPELKRVIVAYENQVVMRATLEDSLTAIFGEPSETQIADKPVAQPSTPAAAPEQEFSKPASDEFTNLIESAAQAYENAQAALQKGDWASYGRYQQDLGKLLQQLEGQAEGTLSQE